MGVLVPQDFPLEQLANDAERLVVRSLLDQLRDGWYVIPDVAMVGDRDRQTDIVIAHARDGVAVIEVKGHRVRIEQGVWKDGDVPMSPQPLAQAQDNAYDLRRRLRAAHPSLGHARVEWAVALPNTTGIEGRLPPGVDRRQVLTCDRLEQLRDSIDELMTMRFGGPIGQPGLDRLLTLLRPDVDFVYDPQARARLARRRLDAICAEHVTVLSRLDLNRRVCVTGGAGSGKTRLAIEWARRALDRGERVLLCCYNDPLGGELVARLPDDARLEVGSYFRLALQLDGMPALEVPDGADSAWWDHTATGHLRANWHRITQRFDAVVVDEAQDFSPAWLAQLEELLDPGGPRRMLMVADEAQGVYVRGFAVPGVDEGWTRCELVTNCRNTFHIARLLSTRLGGPAAPEDGVPEALGIGAVACDDLDGLSELVIEEVDRIVDHEGHAPSRVLVATFSSEVRDRLRAEHAFVRWEDSDDRTVICETVHRAKGLEFDYVVLAAVNDTMSDALLYVGVSRAVAGLTVIGPRSLLDRLGLDDSM
jgi:hypothetical protein